MSQQRRKLSNAALRKQYIFESLWAGAVVLQHPDLLSKDQFSLYKMLAMFVTNPNVDLSGGFIVPSLGLSFFFCCRSVEKFNTVIVPTVEKMSRTGMTP